MYFLAGRFAQVVMVNSNWTKSHINLMWRTNAVVVFPPCDTADFIASQSKSKSRVVVSLGQFRPEKDHRLQLKSIQLLRNLLNDDTRMPKLIIFGSCRDEQDEKMVGGLKVYSQKLGIDSFVEFHVNLPYSELKVHLAKALIGIHTMWNEHFGIAPVEMMAAGIILVAHSSGGPKVDIIEHGVTGYLAESAEEYSNTIFKILEMYDNSGGDDSHVLAEMRESAVISVDRFSQDKFFNSFTNAIAPLIN